MLEKYQLYRKVLMELHYKILDTIVRDKLVQAAKILKVYKKEKFHFDNEDGINYLFDFVIYEKFIEDTSSIDLYLNMDIKFTNIEKTLLNGMKNATNSIYQIKKLDPLNHQLILEDLINIGQNATLTDINLSQTTIPSMILFTRVIKLDFFNLTSGMMLIFDAEQKENLLNQAKRQSLLERDDVLRYINIYHENRRMGIPVTFK